MTDLPRGCLLAAIGRVKLADILAEINDAGYRPRTTLTFSGFVKKYRELKLPTK